jgi:hypothetical protein
VQQPAAVLKQLQKDLLKVTLKIRTEKELRVLIPGSAYAHSPPNIWNITQIPYISDASYNKSGT